MLGIGAIGAAVTIAGFKFDSMRQQAQIAFTTMLKSGSKAKAFLDKLQAFAARTPFEFADLTRASQRLLAMGFKAKEILPTMTAVGDAVAGLGGDPQVMQQVITAMGQIQAKGKVAAEEMLQLTEAGIPAWDMLAKKMGVSVPKAMELVTKRAVSSKTAIDALVTGMEDRFGGMMEKQSHTLAGLWSTFKDTFSQISGQVMQPFFEMATSGLEGINKLLGKLASHDKWSVRARIVLSNLGELKDQVAGALFGQTETLKQTKRESRFGRSSIGPTTKFSPGLLQKAGDALSQVDWNAVGKKAGELFGRAFAESFKAMLSVDNWISGLFGSEQGKEAGGNFGSGFVEGFVGGVDWGELGRKALSNASNLNLSNLGGKLGADLLLGLASKVASIDWGGVWKKITDALPTDQEIGQAGNRLANRFMDAIGGLAGRLAGLGGRLGRIVFGWGQDLGQAGLRAGGRLLEGIRDKASNIPGWLQGLGGRAISAVANWVGGFARGAARIGSSFVSTLKEKFSSLPSALTGLLRRALNAVIGVWNGLSIPSFSIGIHKGPIDFDFSSPSVSLPDIPTVAKGGVFTEPTLALIGETRSAVPEIATPQRLMAQTFRDVLREANITPAVRVFIGDRELTDIVRIEVDSGLGDLAGDVSAGTRR